MHDRTLFKVDEVAERLRLNPETIRRMLRAGKIHGAMPGGPRAGWRIPASEVERLLVSDQEPDVKMAA